MPHEGVAFLVIAGYKHRDQRAPWRFRGQVRDGGDSCLSLALLSNSLSQIRGLGKLGFELQESNSMTLLCILRRPGYCGVFLQYRSNLRISKRKKKNKPRSQSNHRDIFGVDAHSSSLKLDSHSKCILARTVTLDLSSLITVMKALLASSQPISRTLHVRSRAK